MCNISSPNGPSVLVYRLLVHSYSDTLTLLSRYRYCESRVSCEHEVYVNGPRKDGEFVLRLPFWRFSLYSLQSKTIFGHPVLILSGHGSRVSSEVSKISTQSQKWYTDLLSKVSCSERFDRKENLNVLFLRQRKNDKSLVFVPII